MPSNYLGICGVTNLCREKFHHHVRRRAVIAPNYTPPRRVLYFNPAKGGINLFSASANAKSAYVAVDESEEEEEDEVGFGVPGRGQLQGQP